jgi:DnaJ-class molecular chaperone
MIALILALIGASGTGSWWWWHGHHRPNRACPKCNGQKYIPVRGRSLIGAPKRFKECPKCEATGRVLKWQARRGVKHGRRLA